MHGETAARPPIPSSGLSGGRFKRSICTREYAHQAHFLPEIDRGLDRASPLGGNGRGGGDGGFGQTDEPNQECGVQDLG